MKKVLLLAGVASLFAFSASAFEFNPYLSAKAKYSFSDNTVRFSASENSAKNNIDKDLFGLNFALGAKFGLPCGAIRTEAEYVRTFDAKKNFDGGENGVKAEIRTQGLMINAYYDFDTGSAFVPYIGGGLGGARIKYSANEQSIHQTNFAWQLGLGVAYEFNAHFAADLGYRYINYGDFSDYLKSEEDTAKTKVRSQANEILLGLRYTF